MASNSEFTSLQALAACLCLLDVKQKTVDICASDLNEVNVSMSNMNISDKCENDEMATLQSNKTNPEIINNSYAGVSSFDVKKPWNLNHFLKFSATQLTYLNENMKSSDNAHVSPIHADKPWNMNSFQKFPPLKSIRSDKNKKSVTSLGTLSASLTICHTLVIHSRRFKPTRYGIKFHCEACGKFLKTRQDYESHWNNHKHGRGLVRQVHICKYCEKVCAGIYRYREHRLLGCFVDSKNKSSIMDLSMSSSSSNTTSSNVLQEMNTNNNCLCHPYIPCNGFHTCGICGQVLNNLKSLHKHYHLHEEQYACTFCGKTGTKHDMIFHSKKEHGWKKIRSFIANLRDPKRLNKLKTKARDEAKKSKTKTRTCKKCHAIFDKKKAFLKHKLKRRHDVNSQKV